MQSRREFMKTIAAGSAVAASGASLLSCSAQVQNKLENFGFISGIIKNEIQADWKAALKQAADFGFTEYEGGMLGDSSEEFLSYCREIGLKPVCGGIGFTDNADDLQADFDKIKTLNMPYVITYWPWQTGGPFMLEDCKKSAEILNKMGELAKANDLKFCWHNHNKEFAEMEEGLPFDYLMDNTDPELVQVEMDIYWVKKGGADPLEVLKKYVGRIPILHVKDMAPGEEEDFACPGSGIIDFTPIFAEAHEQGIQHYFVERDNCPDGMGCLESSSAFLKSVRF